MLKDYSLQVLLQTGNNANEIFIENGRFHGECIARTIEQRKNNDRGCIGM